MADSSKKKAAQKEQWKAYPFKGVPKSSQHIEVSNLGRVRSNSQVSKGAILKGSLTEGYRKISLRFIEPRSRAGQLRFLKSKATLFDEKQQLADAAQQLTEMKKKKLASAAKFTQQLKKRKELYEQHKLAYKEELLKEERSRTTFPGALVHRMVAETFCKRQSPKYSFVIHLDHNRLNNRATNLAWATKEQMEAHQQKSPYVKAAKKAQIGRRSGTYSLNETKVKVIKRMLAKGKTTKETIANTFGVSSTQVKRIERGENWGDVKL